MRNNQKSFSDWKKEWMNSNDIKALTRSLENVDQLYDTVRNSIGRILMSAEMIEIQEIIEERIEKLKSKDGSKVAA
ncbi:MAG TPA: hypothetical protein ENN22_11495 [bacterium]|nr:hypothetical protein [bacterium]